MNGERLTPRRWNMQNRLGVHADRKVHRIVDFFSAAQTISDGRLYVPLASNFDDPNEGIDSAIEILAISGGPCAGITSHFATVEDFKQHQASATSRTYISCWTKTRESVAMWALYSRDMSSIQMTTTVGKLQEAAATLEVDPCDAVDRRIAPGQFLNEYAIREVAYEPLSQIAKKIDRRRRAYDKLDALGKVKELRKGEFGSGRDWQRSRQYHFDRFCLKDGSFSHEAEVRLILDYTPYDAQTLDTAANEWDALVEKSSYDGKDTEYAQNRLDYLRAVLRENGYKRRLKAVSNVWLPIPCDFVSEVTIDPRCSPHKRRFMQEFFGDKGIVVTESGCFGHMASKFSVQPRRKLSASTDRRKQIDPSMGAEVGVDPR